METKFKIKQICFFFTFWQSWSYIKSVLSYWLINYLRCKMREEEMWRYVALKGFKTDHKLHFSQNLLCFVSCNNHGLLFGVCEVDDLNFSAGPGRLTSGGSVARHFRGKCQKRIGWWRRKAAKAARVRARVEHVKLLRRRRESVNLEISHFKWISVSNLLK